jgi:uncharacterized protein (TIGR00255 family)
MIQSMTGFGSKEADIAALGKISVQMRSTNHKFLEIVFHLPEGFLSLEDKIKKLIETQIKRGRVICSVNISGGAASNIYINKLLLSKYLSTLKSIKKQFALNDDINFNNLIHLPGILSLGDNAISGDAIWPQLKPLIISALEELVKTRQREGRALYVHLKNRALAMQKNLNNAKLKFKQAIRNKLKKFSTDEERSGFLKDSDICEEIERLAFHAKNFKNKLSKSGPIGKELDFIAQEMQREANTMAAKSFDVSVSSRVVQMKSQVEKIREQVQNIE